MKTDYFEKFSGLFEEIEATDNKGKVIPFDSAFSKIINLIPELAGKGNKVILIGNGGSASIASHIATDLLKNGGIAAITFNDASLLTCIGNDLGFEFVFQKPLEMLARSGDILFSISSSGRSKNILLASQEAKRKGCFLVTLSGFDKENPLRKSGDINIYLASSSYGYVETAHLLICHSIVDKIIEKRKLKNG